MHVSPQAVLAFVVMVLSLSFHEFSHAIFARSFGDDTAERQGRITLNPLSHIDVLGTLVIPALGALTGVPLIGWARPVPVNAARFRRGVNRRRAMAMVSAAGPLANLTLAIVALAALAFGGAAVASRPGLYALLGAMFEMNVGLFVFNLLPLAPLDGSRLTPAAMDRFQARVAPYSAFILVGILAEPHLRHYLVELPVEIVASGLAALFGMHAL